MQAGVKGFSPSETSYTAYLDTEALDSDTLLGASALWAGGAAGDLSVSLVMARATNKPCMLHCRGRCEEGESRARSHPSRPPLMPLVSRCRGTSRCCRWPGPRSATAPSPSPPGGPAATTTRSTWSCRRCVRLSLLPSSSCLPPPPPATPTHPPSRSRRDHPPPAPRARSPATPPSPPRPAPSPCGSSTARPRASPPPAAPTRRSSTRCPPSTARSTRSSPTSMSSTPFSSPTPRRASACGKITRRRRLLRHPVTRLRCRG